MTKILFEGRHVGAEVGAYVKFHIVGMPDKEWELMRILRALEKLAGTYLEEIFHTKDHAVSVRIYSEPSEMFEQPRTNAILIEDYSGEPHKVVVVFPYSQVSDEAMVMAIETVKSQNEAMSETQPKKP